ncbi:MAG: phenylacetate--CoA ligase [Coriobacteriaceae bacterium]|nr:phenylacetate--CoA ligase [Coriobacteriaceae bacterium]
MFYQEELETMPREEIEKLQLDRVKNLVHYVYERIPLYKERFDEAGVSPDDLQTLDDLRKFPFTVKQDLRDSYPFGMFAVPIDEVARIHCSSGTTGTASVVGYTEHDLDEWGDCFARFVRAADCGPGSVMQVAYGYGLFTGGLGAHEGGQHAGCAMVPTSTGNTKRQVRLLRDFKVEVLACTPSYALVIADTAKAMGIDKSELHLKAAILGAEPCSEGMRKEIEQKLDCQVYDIYGLSEVMGPGVSCECGEQHGLHVNEDKFIIEIVDPETFEPLPDGQWGEVVFTTLTKECSPLVRYRTRDISRIIPGTCPCGRTGRRMDRIAGRTDDMLIIRGVNVFPVQFAQVISEFPEVTSYYQIILTLKGPLDHVELHVETVMDFPFDEIRRLQDLKKRIEAALKENLQVAVDVKIVEPMTIERSEGKAKRIIDLRGEANA